MKPRGKPKPASDPIAFLTEINSGRAAVGYEEKQVIFSQGGPADSVFYIQKGKVKLTVLSKQGKEAVAAILGIGDFFGEGCLAGQSLRKGTAISISRCSIMKLAKSVVIHALHEAPLFSEMFVAHLLSRNMRTEEDLVDQLFNFSEKRLARTLLSLANFGKEGTPQTVSLKLSQETLAEIVGTTRSRINFFMNRFRKLGFIHYGHDGGLQIDSSLLDVVPKD
jgi:CRP-like cAMP-binding protein